MKRILAILLTVLMIVSLAGCSGKKKRQPIQLTLSTEDSVAIMAAAGVKLPDEKDAAGANSVVKYCSWIDLFQNYSENEIVQTGYWTFQQKYNSSIEWIETTYEEHTNTLANLIMSDNSPDMTNAGTSNFAVFPMNCINNMYQPIDKWIDYDNDPLWKGMKDAAEYFSLGDVHFTIVTELAFKDIVPYNRRVIQEWGFDDPAELYYNDEWTWDVFYDMAVEFSDGDENRYALDGWYIVNGICEESSGRYIIEKDASGNFYSNLDDPVIEIAQNMMYDLVKEDCFYHEGNNYWANRNNAEYGAGVQSGQCLFWICDVKEGIKRPVDEVKSIWGDITEEEIMFAPLPRYQDGDGVYYLNAMPTGYMIIAGAKNADGAVLLASCDRFKIMDPTVVNIDKKQLKDKYLWTEEMLDMYDTCEDIMNANVRMFYTGNLPENLQRVYNTFDWNIRRSGGSSTWAQLKESNRDSLEFYIEDLNDLIANYEYTGEYTGK